MAIRDALANGQDFEAERQALLVHSRTRKTWWRKAKQQAKYSYFDALVVDKDVCAWMLSPGFARPALDYGAREMAETIVMAGKAGA